MIKRGGGGGGGGEKNEEENKEEEKRKKVAENSQSKYWYLSLSCKSLKTQLWNNPHFARLFTFKGRKQAVYYHIADTELLPMHRCRGLHPHQVPYLALAELAYFVFVYVYAWHWLVATLPNKDRLISCHMNTQDSNLWRLWHFFFRNIITCATEVLPAALPTLL